MNDYKRTILMFSEGVYAIKGNRLGQGTLVVLFWWPEHAYNFMPTSAFITALTVHLPSATRNLLMRY